MFGFRIVVGLTGTRYVVTTHLHSRVLNRWGES